jgi:hypothetical protein
MKCKSLEEWSDTESSDEENELVQPNRDFPISEDEEELAEDLDGDLEEFEDEEFDICDLAKKIVNTNMTDDLFIKEEKKIVDKPINKQVIKPTTQKTETIKPKGKRKFNPRLPPPNKYNKINDNKFNFNLNDFPAL